MPIDNSPPPSWHHKLWRVIFIVFCFELGIFLLVFPWLEYWDNNSIASLSPWLRAIWDNAYFRGALSGLGIVNLLISFAEVFRFRRPPLPPEDRFTRVDPVPRGDTMEESSL